MRTQSKTHTPEEKEEVETEWEWQDDDEQWVLYTPAECAEINAAVQAGKKHMSCSWYELDLVQMSQTNSVTKYCCKIRKSDKVDSDEGTSGLRIKKKEDGRKKKRKGRVRKGRSTKESGVLRTVEVLKTVLMKGKAPVDPECNVKVGKAHIYGEGDDVYDVMLNQTNLRDNTNKYYLIQLLQDDHIRSYSVWRRWGRVGHDGKSTLKLCGDDLANAKDVFMEKFFLKTGNKWTERENFKKLPEKYDMLSMDYGVSDKVDSTEMMPTASSMKQSQLDVKLKSLMDLIYDIKAMEECVLEMKFDPKKAPLGKLRVEQIKAGYSSLKKIKQCLKTKKKKKQKKIRIKKHKQLVEACNEFYTRIPHDFGLQPPPIIHSENELKGKIALLKYQFDIQVAVRLVQSQFSSEHPIDKHYRALNCVLQPLDSATHEYKVIVEYLQSTHADTHKNYTMTVVDIFSVERAGEKGQFLSSLHNRMLLWHGSRLSNWVGILNQGLQVSPDEAPVTGNMFGKGIYFSDMSSKSANYCHPSLENAEGLLLLSEVALGDCNELMNPDYSAGLLPPEKMSTKGLGLTAPDPNNSITLDSATVPLGPGVKTEQNRGYTLLYNEYVVYNPAQVLMKYLLRIQFHF